MIQTRYTQYSENNRTNAVENAETAPNAAIFYPVRQACQRNRLLVTLLIVLSLTGSAILATLAILFWPTYTHPFTPYLKWQDALLATLAYSSFLLLLASLIVFRFRLACRRAERRGILILHPQGTLTVRDLSPKNFAGIYRMIGASFTCFLGTLVGLSPCILIGLTLHITAQPLLTVLATAIAIILSLLGLTVTLISATFLVISLIGARAYALALGAPHTYLLTTLISLRIDGLTLTITYPDRPETLFDLNLLHPHHQRHLLHLLQQHPPHTHAQPHSPLDQHIAAALQDSLHRPHVSV
jgi:hypothetical protein